MSAQEPKRRILADAPDADVTIGTRRCHQRLIGREDDRINAHLMSDLRHDKLAIGDTMEVKVLIETPGRQQASRRGEDNEDSRSDMSPESSHETPIGDAKEQHPSVFPCRGDELTVGREREAPTRDDRPKLRGRSRCPLSISESRYNHNECEHDPAHDATLSHIFPSHRSLFARAIVA
jgi:hypothetical protein